jgi:hypothetical protein
MFKAYDLSESIMPKTPFEKKKSGPGGASLPPTSHDFNTGNVPARLPGMPRAGIASSSSSSSSSSSRIDPRPRTRTLPVAPLNPGLQPQHLQVVDDFAVDYAKTLQASDEEFRRTHARHPHESLMSIHKRQLPDSDLLVSNGECNIPDPITYVAPEFVFSQAALPGGRPWRYLPGALQCLHALPLYRLRSARDFRKLPQKPNDVCHGPRRNDGVPK